MGGVVVLNPQDFLSGRTLISPAHTKKPRNPNPNRANRTQPNRRKRSPTRPSTPPATIPSRTASQKAPSKNIVMGQVKILKRGEKLAKTASDEESHGEPDLGSTERLGPDPVSIPTQIRLTTESKAAAGFYAGSSALIASPPPSSLPLPAFFTKKCVSANIEDVASDLRRILRLD
ncbi:hypothetical protein CJ030_MR8G012742 [Morella rubra]|uniref:Uncharacterized protein n=1 Tax=Morella rubra TaxID=262757 RepID=A0A6A1V015_9ROSI|nr:hypothetical protein CJ030_MR8G012742 [Morella rubra]